MILWPRFDAPAEEEDDILCAECNDCADGFLDDEPLCANCAKDRALEMLEEDGRWKRI